MMDGRPAASDSFVRGLQTSGLAWDGRLLWSVGDQRSEFPGHIFAISPETSRLVRAPVALRSDHENIEAQLRAWGRIDLEGIEILSRVENRFLVVVEDEATAALIMRINAAGSDAQVEAIWQFRFPDGQVPTPYRNDQNYRLEGVAIDPIAARGYVAYERDESGRPLLYQFDLRRSPQTGIGPVELEPVPFGDWDRLDGKKGAILNVNGLEFVRTAAGAARLFVLCRDREILFAIDPATGQLIGQVELDLRSPEGDKIEWVSPEGIAIDSDRGVVYIISDPDSTDGNWRLRSTPQAAGNFSKFVPLLFEMKIPSELMR